MAAGAIMASRTPAEESSASWASIQSGSRNVRWATGWSRPLPSATTVAHHRFHAAMLAVSAGRDVESRRSHNNPKFGNTTASSRPITSRCRARADGSQ